MRQRADFSDRSSQHKSVVPAESQRAASPDAGVVPSVLVRPFVRTTAEPWIWFGPSEVARPGV